MARSTFVRIAGTYIKQQKMTDLPMNRRQIRLSAGYFNDFYAPAVEGTDAKIRIFVGVLLYHQPSTYRMIFKRAMLR